MEPRDMTDDPSETIHIFQSSDYSKFQYLAKNRTRSEEHVKRLGEKIKLHGYSKHYPIEVVQKEGVNYITAGQHRFKACKNNDLAFWYTFIAPEDEDKSVMGQHNGGYKEWSDSERLHRFVTLGNENYEMFHDVMRSYDFLTINTTLWLVFGLNTETGQPLVKDMKKTFIEGMAVSKSQIENALELAEMISQIINRKAKHQSRYAKKPSFLRALYMLIHHPNFSMARLREAIDNSEYGLKCEANYKETLEWMTIFYNKRCNKSNRLKFSFVEDSLTRSRQLQKWGKVE